MFILNGQRWYVQIVNQYDKNLRMENGEYTVGSCNDNTKTIYLSNRIKGKYLKHVLCHEIVHCAMFSYNVRITLEQEELIANIIATYGEKIIEKTNDMFKRLH